MHPKDKGPKELVNPLIYPPIDFHHIPLADRDHKIHEAVCKFDLFEMYCWLEEKYIDKSMTFSCGNPIYPTTFFPVPTTPQNLLGSVMHVILQAKGPSFPPLEKLFLRSLVKP